MAPIRDTSLRAGMDNMHRMEEATKRREKRRQRLNAPQPRLNVLKPNEA